MRAQFYQRKEQHFTAADIKRYLKLECSVSTVRNALKSNMAGPPYAAGREDRKGIGHFTIFAILNSPVKQEAALISLHFSCDRKALEANSKGSLFGFLASFFHRERFAYKTRLAKPCQSDDLAVERLFMMLEMPEDWEKDCHAHFDQWTIEIPEKNRVRLRPLTLRKTAKGRGRTRPSFRCFSRPGGDQGRSLSIAPL